MTGLRASAKIALESMGMLEPFRKVSRGLATVCAPITNLAHYVSEYAYRLPNPALKFRLDRGMAVDVQAAVERLRRDGIVILPQYFSGDYLHQVQESFHLMIEEIKSKPPSPQRPLPSPWQHTMGREQAYDSDLEETYSNDPFKHDLRFLSIALNEFILDVIARFIGKKFMLHQAAALRYYPTVKREFGSWQWHHDAWGRKVNVLVLLTNVTERDQYLSYMSGSHRLVHSKARYENSRFTEDEVNGYPGLKRVDCICTAGTVLIFDSNGFHRGNRSLGSVRDSFIFQYNAGRYIWPFVIPKAFLESLNERQRSFLRRNPRITYARECPPTR